MRTGNLLSQCVEEGSFWWEVLTALTEADRKWLSSHGWPGFHRFRTCGGGCGSCSECESCLCMPYW